MGTFNRITTHTHTHTHTHTRTHNVRFTIPNRRRQGRLQSCRQEATTIHRRSAKISHGKGGEEGGRSFNNDAFGMICKAASYSMMGNAITASGEEETFTQEGPITV